MAVAVRLRVDPIACEAFGYCAELLPERITLDEWGYPLVAGEPVPTELVERARRAGAACPRRAVHLEQVRRTDDLSDASAAGRARRR